MEKEEMEEQEFKPQYPAELYTSRPNPTALLSPIYDSTFIIEKMTMKKWRGIL